jgi:uncharacterized protein YbjT (DUF2867 family)
MTKMTILVTGATGNVGRPLTAQLLAGGHRVRAMTRNPAKAELPAGAEVVAGDLGDPASLAAAAAGADAVHLISLEEALANAPAIVAALKEAGVRRVTVLKGGTYASPLDEAVTASGLEHTFLSPVEFMSNALEWATSVQAEGVVREGFPESKSAMVHDADIASVAATALTNAGHDGKDYWLTGPEVLTPPEKVRLLGAAIGRELTFIPLTQEEIAAQWRGEGYPEEDIEFFIAMRTDPPEAGYTVLPTVEEVTGRPARTFAEWAREHAAAFGA